MNTSLYAGNTVYTNIWAPPLNEEYRRALIDIGRVAACSGSAILVALAKEYEKNDTFGKKSRCASSRSTRRYGPNGNVN